MVGVIGHRQVTDAYLVALARRHGGHVATWTPAWLRSMVGTSSS